MATIPKQKEEEQKEYASALERAKAIAQRMRVNMTQQLLKPAGAKRAAEGDHYANEQPIKLNPYGTGTGLPTKKSDMLLPMMMGTLISTGST